MPEFDLLIKDGMIFDGMLAPRFRDDIDSWLDSLWRERTR
jgi:hypothetical protein